MEAQVFANNNTGLTFPFLSINFKADGPNGAGGLWVATNQCLGTSASCVNIAERFVHQLQNCDKGETFHTAAFSIAMNATEARLFVSWKHDEPRHHTKGAQKRYGLRRHTKEVQKKHDEPRYHTKQVQSFALQEPEQFRKIVPNIIDWGMNERLEQIRAALDSLLEEEDSLPEEDEPSPRGGSASGGSGDELA